MQSYLVISCTELVNNGIHTTLLRVPTKILSRWIHTHNLCIHKYIHTYTRTRVKTLNACTGACMHVYAHMDMHTFARTYGYCGVHAHTHTCCHTARLFGLLILCLCDSDSRLNITTPPPNPLNICKPGTHEDSSSTQTTYGRSPLSLFPA